MGLFERLFGNKTKDASYKGYFSTLTAYQPTFCSRSGGLYEMDQTRAAVHAIANHCSKLKPHVVGSAGKKWEKMLQLHPNPWQTTSQFLYRLATILEVENTAFIVPIKDQYGRITGLYPVLPARVEIVRGTDDVMYLRYEFAEGKHALIEYEACGVMTKMQYRDDIFGSDNAALSPTMDLINTQNQGIQEGIKQAAAIRFMAKLGSSMRQEDIKKEQERFRTINFGADNNNGVLMFDQKYAEVKQVESKPYIIDADQMKIINNNVEKYFGVNEKILKNEWDESTWNAFYEGKIEPFAVQLSLVLTWMMFTDREISTGNEITISANRLQFATINNKVQIITQLFDRGMLTFNEGREILQLPPVENGDRFMIRGEYMTREEKEKDANAGSGNQGI